MKCTANGNKNYDHTTQVA